MDLITHFVYTAGADPYTFAIGVGLSILAGLLLDNANPIDTDKPTTLSARGSYPTWICGRDLVAPVFCWAGLNDREIRSEKPEGGKGIGAPDQDVYYEAGLHLLTWGTCHALRGIVQGGKFIMHGALTPESHPSGSTVDLGSEGSFEIYWGEVDQPVNTFLADSSRLGISSRWPYACYILWNKKRLGPSPSWPNLQYILERRPSNSHISGSDPWYDDEETLTGPTHDVLSANANASPTVGYLEFAGDFTDDFQPTWSLELAGNGLANGTYEILRVEVVQFALGTTTPNGYGITVPRTRVFLTTGTLGADSLGTAQAYEPVFSSGVNIAHAIAEALFAPFPFGAGIDPDHAVERWGLTGLIALGAEAEASEWRSVLVSSQGETLADTLSAALLDHNVLLTLSSSGEYCFVSVREPVGTLPNFQSEVYGGVLPEIETDRDGSTRTRIVYAFKEASSNFGKRTISIDNDGAARYTDLAQAQEVNISTTRRFDTAALLVNLREPQDLTKHSQMRLELSREARDLIPGDAFTLTGIGQVLRTISVKVDPQAEVVGVSAIVDAFGVAKSTFVPSEGGGQVEIVRPAQDTFAWLEVPEQLLGTFPQAQTVMVPRIRDNLAVYFASIHISSDNITYQLDLNQRGVAFGGTLIDALSADGPTFLAQGPTFTELGPDNSSAVDLSASLANWGLGRQVVAIVSTEGIEICFLQKSTVVSATTRRLDGLVRARYDTRKSDHPAGAVVYIFAQDALEPVRDPLLSPEADLYVKSQPGTTGGQVSLAAVPAYGELLYGKGQRPITPDQVRLRAPFVNVPAFLTGNDVTVAWSASTGSVSTGAGAQPAGTITGIPETSGDFELRFYNAGNTFVGSLFVDDALQTVVTNAQLVTLFGSEPASFRITVRQRANGRASNESPQLLITRL